MRRLFKNFSSNLSQLPPFLLSIMVVCVIAMNLLANKSVDTGLAWLGMDAGVLVSGIFFLTMDIITQKYGLWCANCASIYALCVNLLVSLIFLVASLLPGFWGESYMANGDINSQINIALNKTFKGSWYVILGSGVAFLISSLLNNFLNNAIGKAIKNKNKFFTFALRSYLSTIISQFVDNMIFSLLVSKLFFNWSFIKCLTCACIGAVLELFFEIFISPLGYKLSKNLNPKCEEKQGDV